MSNSTAASQFFNQTKCFSYIWLHMMYSIAKENDLMKCILNKFSNYLAIIRPYTCIQRYLFNRRQLFVWTKENDEIWATSHVIC